MELGNLILSFDNDAELSEIERLAELMLEQIYREAAALAAEIEARPTEFTEEWEGGEGWKSPSWEQRILDAVADVEPWPDPLTQCFERAGIYLHVLETPFGTVVYRLPWNERYCERCQLIVPCG